LGVSCIVKYGIRYWIY